MNVNKIELEIEQVSELVKNNLIYDYHMMVEDIKNLEFQKKCEPLPSYKEEDLAYIIEIRDAMKIILKYYMIPSEYKEIFPE